MLNRPPQLPTKTISSYLTAAINVKVLADTMHSKVLLLKVILALNLTSSSLKRGCLPEIHGSMPNKVNSGDYSIIRGV